VSCSSSLKAGTGRGHGLLLLPSPGNRKGRVAGSFPLPQRGKTETYGKEESRNKAGRPSTSA